MNRPHRRDSMVVMTVCYASVTSLFIVSMWGFIVVGGGVVFGGGRLFCVRMYSLCVTFNLRSAILS